MSLNAVKNPQLPSQTTTIYLFPGPTDENEVKIMWRVTDGNPFLLFFAVEAFFRGTQGDLIL